METAQSSQEKQRIPDAVDSIQSTGTTTHAKADLVKRIIAFVIDAVLSAAVGLVPFIGAIVGTAYMLVRDGLDVEFMDKRSLGKKLMKLRPVRLDGQPMDIVASIKRNVPFAIAPAIMIVPILGWFIALLVGPAIAIIEVVLVLTDAQGRRLGDRFAETVVVDTDD